MVNIGWIIFGSAFIILGIIVVVNEIKRTNYDQSSDPYGFKLRVLLDGFICIIIGVAIILQNL